MQATNLASNNLQPFLSSPFSGGPSGNLRFISQGQFPSMKEKEGRSYYADTLRAAAAPAMNSAVSMLMDTGRSAFDARVAQSSNPLAVVGEAASGATQATYTVSVSQLASGQNAVSDQLAAADANSIGRGTYSFLLNLQNTDIRFNVDVNAADTNEQVLTKISDEINKAGLGVQASVEHNYAAKTAQLQVSGVLQGDMHSYTMRDEGSSKLLDSIGFSTAREAVGVKGGLTQTAGNAVFSINGAQFESDSNRVTLFENSVTFQFRQITLAPDNTAANIESRYSANGGSENALPGRLASTRRGAGGREGSFQSELTLTGAGTVKISVKPDAEKIAGSINSFVRNSSNLSSTLSQGREAGFKRAGNYIAEQFNRSSNALKSLGFEDGGGGIQVSRDKLTEKIDSRFEDVKKVFGEPAGLARSTIFGVQRAVYAPFAATSWVRINPSAAVAAGFFHDSVV